MSLAFIFDLDYIGDLQSKLGRAMLIQMILVIEDVALSLVGITDVLTYLIDADQLLDGSYLRPIIGVRISYDCQFGRF